MDDSIDKTDITNLKSSVKSLFKSLKSIDRSDFINLSGVGIRIGYNIPGHLPSFSTDSFNTENSINVNELNNISSKMKEILKSLENINMKDNLNISSNFGDLYKSIAIDKGEYLNLVTMVSDLFNSLEPIDKSLERGTTGYFKEIWKPIKSIQKQQDRNIQFSIRDLFKSYESIDLSVDQLKFKSEIQDIEWHNIFNIPDIVNMDSKIKYKFKGSPIQVKDIQDLNTSLPLNLKGDSIGYRVG